VKVVTVVTAVVTVVGDSASGDLAMVTVVGESGNSTVVTVVGESSDSGDIGDMAVVT
jgi:hypothetical protein